MKRVFLTTLPVLLALLMLACSGSNDADSIKDVSPAPGELRLAIFAEPRTLDAARAGLTADVSVLRQLFRGLLWYDEDLNLKPMVAREMPSVDSDGRVYRFRLRDDFKWSDGRAVVAGDFEYALKRLLDPTSDGAQVATYYDITGAEKLNRCQGCSEAELVRLRQEVGVRALDDSTLVITLHQAHSTFLHLLAQPVASPMRRDIIEQEGDAWTKPGKLVSNGPFVLKEWIEGDRLVLEPNPYWDSGKHNIDRLILRVQSDALDAFNAYLAGELDAVDVPPELRETVQTDPTLRAQNLQLPSILTYSFFMNQTKAPFNNKSVRQAFSMAIDREAVVHDALQGEAQGTHGWIPRGIPGYDKNAGSQWRFDPARARSLLAEAGFQGGANLAPITFTYYDAGPNAKIAASLKRQLQENLGVSIDLKRYGPEERALWRDEFLGRKLQFVWTGVDAAYPDPEGMFTEVWTCQRYDGDKCMTYGAYNFSWYANPEFDRLLAQAGKETDLKRRLDLYSRAQKLMIEDAPTIITAYRTRNILVKPYVEGAVHTSLDFVASEMFMERVRVSN